MTLQRIIVRGYPVSLLPDDLKGDFEIDARVTVTVEMEGSWMRGSTAVEIIHEFQSGKVVKLSERAFVVQ